MSSLFYKTLLRDFCRLANMSELSFDRDGACDLVIDGQEPLRLQQDEKNHRLLMIGMLDNDPPLDPYLLLEANMFQLTEETPSIGWNEQDKLYYLWFALDNSTLNAAQIVAKVAKLIEFIRQWHRTGEENK